MKAEETSIRSLWETQRPLFGRILDLNTTLGDIHPERVERLFPLPLVRWVSENGAKSFSFLEALRKRIGVEKISFGQFQMPLHRLLLLTGQEILQLSQYMGAAFYGEEIVKTVYRPVRQQLRQVLGEKIYGFATARSPLYRPFLKGIEIPPRYRPDGLPEKVCSGGKYAIECCLSSAPGDVTERFLMKFPETDRWTFSHAVDFETKTRIYGVLKRLINKEMNHPVGVCL
jgi:hypothetical protein